MENIQLKSHIGDDGILKVQVPTELQNTEVEVLVVFQATTDTGKEKIEKARGWPSGFFEKTWGSCTDDPIIIDAGGVSPELDDDAQGIFKT